jgi:antitoxin component YwqK of YwqJK toxin-antitoxin module
MKKKYVIILMILWSTISFGQVKNEPIEVIVGAEKEIIPKIGDTISEYYLGNEKLKKEKFRNEKIFTIRDYNENGEIYKSTDFPLENLKLKTLTKYHANGNIILIANYDNGIVTGFFQKFYDNGNKMQIGNYEEMKKLGEWKYFDENGNLEKTETYENGKLVE